VRCSSLKIYNHVDGRINKTVISSKVRLVFFIGMEGSGHHYFTSSFENMFKEDHPNVVYLDECELKTSYYLTTSMTGSPSKYTESYEEAREGMRRLALKGEKISNSGGIALIQGGSCPMPQMSYPTMGGMEKVNQYIDIRMLAEVAEAEGVDLRVVYLKRSAEEIVIADTQHRMFQNGLGRDSNNSSVEELFMHYMRILFTDIGAMHSGMDELSPDFFVCHDFDKLGDPDQMSRIADFISPKKDISKITYDAFQSNFTPHEEVSEEIVFDRTDVLLERFQGKLDVLSSTFCQ